MPLSTMPTEVLTAKGNMKFKITTKGIWDKSGDKSGSGKTMDSVKNGQKVKVSGTGNEPSMLPAKSLKRKPEVSLDCQKGKKAKMDRTLKIHCGSILKDLLRHKFAHVFLKPVDPVALNIPDYFSVISKPMDLGTVKRKLEGNMYFSADDFAADVKLTFSNATTYNPKENPVHAMAKEMNSEFCRRWKSLEAKFKQMNHNDDRGSFLHHVETNAPVIKKGVGNNIRGTKTSGLDKKSIGSLPDDKKMWKLRTEGGSMDAACEKMKPARTTLNKCSSLRRTTLNKCSSLRRTVQKEPCSQSVSLPAKHGKSLNSGQAKCSSCVSFLCHCRLRNGPAQATTSDFSSERSPENYQSGGSKCEYKVKHSLASHRGSFSQEIDGPGVVIHEEKSPELSAPATTVASIGGLSIVDVNLSPDKALRAALLKSRFADTIFKATHQVQKSDPITMRQEKERLEREKQLERARIDAEIKAAEAASRRKEQIELKIRRERERAAARMALQETKKTVEIYESMDIMKDVEMLSFGCQRGKFLEQFGLYLKQDYIEEEEEEEASYSAEEGEILS